MNKSKEIEILCPECSKTFTYIFRGGRKKVYCDKCLKIVWAKNKKKYRSKPEVKAHIKKQQTKYYQKSDVREKRQEYLKKYYSDPENRKRRNETTIKSRMKNIENYNKHRREKMQNTPSMRLNRTMSNSIRKALMGKKNGHHWENLVDYTLDNLMKHLEKQFTDGMNWNNYGEWHIDHKIPKAVFNFNNPSHEDFKRCWNLKNLQPLWAKDNINKSDNLEKHFQPSLQIATTGY